MSTARAVTVAIKTAPKRAWHRYRQRLVKIAKKASWRRALMEVAWHARHLASTAPLAPKIQSVAPARLGRIVIAVSASQASALRAKIVCVTVTKRMLIAVESTAARVQMA
jgi:hypothetical protein